MVVVVEARVVAEGKAVDVVWDRAADEVWVKVWAGVVVATVARGKVWDDAWAWRHLQVRPSHHTSNHTLNALARKD